MLDSTQRRSLMTDTDKIQHLGERVAHLEDTTENLLSALENLTTLYKMVLSKVDSLQNLPPGFRISPN